VTQQSHAANRTPYSAPQLHPAPCECTPAQVLGAEPSTLARLLCQPDSTVLVLAATASSNLHHHSSRAGLLPPPWSSHSAYGCRTSLQDSYRILHLVHPLSAVAVRSSAAFVFEGSASGSQKKNLTPSPPSHMPPLSSSSASASSSFSPTAQDVGAPSWKHHTWLILRKGAVGDVVDN
jgi:hypothetical protein